MVVFTDKRINQCINDSVRYYRADLRSAYDYYPFGMLIPDRTFDSTAYIQLPDRVDTTISQRIKIQIPNLNPGQNITLTKDGETYVLAQYQSGYTGPQYSATIAGSAIVNELSFEDSSGYLIIENTTLGGQKICSGIPSFSLNVASTNYIINCSQSIDTIQGGLLSEAGYLFGFNGQEKDDEIYGDGSSYTAEYWQYDSRLGRRFNTDPIVKFHESPYACFSNNPIWFIDIGGADTTTAEIIEAGFQGLAEKANEIEEIANKLKIYEQRLKEMEDAMSDHDAWNIAFGVFNPFAGIFMAVNYLVSDAEEIYDQTLAEYDALLNEFQNQVSIYNLLKSDMKSFLNRNDVISFGGGIYFTAAAAAKINLNSNSARGNFALYEVTIDGQHYKWGVADADRTIKSDITVRNLVSGKQTIIPKGTPVRIYQQQRAALMVYNDVSVKYNIIPNETKINVKLLEDRQIYGEFVKSGYLYVGDGNTIHAKRFKAQQRNELPKRLKR